MRSASHLERIRHIAWPGFRFRLPRGWEIAAYRLDDGKGRLEILERTTPRAQLIWRVVPAVPDQKRILNEIYRRNADTSDGLDFGRAGKFLFGKGKKGEIAQASMYVEEQKLLVQWVFPAYGPETRSEIRELLDSYRGNDDDLLEWALFGVRVTLPREYTYASIAPQPANVAITFETKKDMTVVARRIGMVDEVLGMMDLARLVRVLIRRGRGRVLEVQETAVMGHTGVFARFDRRGQRGFEKLTGRWWPGEAWLWHDDKEGRIYGLEQVGPARRPRLELERTFVP